MTDDLRRPLKRRSAWQRMMARRPSSLRVAATVLVSLGVLFTLWVSRLPLPDETGHAVRIAIDQTAVPIDTGSIAGAKQGEATAPDPNDVATADPAEADSPPDAVDLDALPSDASGSGSGQQTAELISPATISLVAAPIKSVVEQGPNGPMPRIGKDGRKPWTVYARPVHRELLAGSGPKIAVVIGGMGLNEDLTAKAIDQLPGEVTLAFAPYATDLQRTVNRARAQGHEVFLQLPMEPLGYPGVNPGPKTLLSTASAQENLDNLSWLMSRFAGYAGVINYMGARFAANRDAMSPILDELSKRGLVFLDEGLATRTPLDDAARQSNLPVRSAALVIDVDTNPGAIEKALADAEGMARSEGLVIVTGSSFPETIAALAKWAKGAKDRGITLVPATAAYRAVSG
ncbi:MAG: divergent polysaccharide deacetylase family protein [Hyphomicrobiales bacterium]